MAGKNGNAGRGRRRLVGWRIRFDKVRVGSIRNGSFNNYHNRIKARPFVRFRTGRNRSCLEPCPRPEPQNFSVFSSTSPRVSRFMVTLPFEMLRRLQFQPSKLLIKTRSFLRERKKNRCWDRLLLANHLSKRENDSNRCYEMNWK